MKCKQPRTKDKVLPVWRRWMMAVAAMGMIMLTGMSAPGESTVQAEESIPLSQRDGKIVLYVSDQADLGLTDDMAQHVDQINYAFALLENGEATDSHWQGGSKISAYLKKRSHIDGVLAVGGWGAEGFSDACATADGRRKLADSILKLMDKHGFVGVDIDWEYPGSSAAGIVSRDDDVENWYQLLQLLRQGLDTRQQAKGRPYYLSVALGAGEEHLSTVDGKRLNALVDQAVIMAYDLKGFDRLTGHHAGLYPDGKTKNSGAYAVQQLTASGLAAKKILMGIPAYGRMWRQAYSEGNGLNVHAATSGNKTLTYPELQALEEKGYRRYYDETAQAAWWYDGSSFVSGEDGQSLKAKADYLRDEGLGGAAVWAQYHDPSGKLLETLNAALTDHFGGRNTRAQQEGD